MVLLIAYFSKAITMTNYQKLLFISNIHYNIFKIKKAIDKQFSMQIVAIMLYFFLSGAALLYYTIVISFVQLAAFNWIEVLQSSFWTTNNIILLFLAASANTVFDKEVSFQIPNPFHQKGMEQNIGLVPQESKIQVLLLTGPFRWKFFIDQCVYGLHG